MEATRPPFSLLTLIFILCMGHAKAALPPSTEPVTATLTSRADEVAKLFCDKPAGFADIFNADFRAKVPDEKLAAILTGVFATAGKCVSVKAVDPLAETHGQFVFGFEDGSTTKVQMVIESSAPHKVSGFFMGPLEHPAKSFPDLLLQLQKLPGTTSLMAAEIVGTDLKLIAEVNPDKQLAIGSSFKLYVLAELVNQVEAGQRHWDDVVHLTEEGRSLPSGFLQKWPVGSPVTLHTLASLMISQSDNTATDTLIRALGREKIEAMVATAGHSNPKLDQPFLTTVEMFKLKGDPGGKFAGEYVADSVDARRTMLAGPVAGLSREQIDFPTSPTHIGDIEWFASTADLGRAMLWLKSHSEKSTSASVILAINPGLQLPSQKWSYIGYKGGSEPGVLNMTYLLQSSGKNGRWFVISATWNNPAKVLDEVVFFGIVQQAVELAGR